MFFPLRDINPTRTTPFVNYLLLLLVVAGWAFQLLLAAQGASGWEMAWAIVPERLLAHPANFFPTLVTSIFLHGDWGHLGGNLLFLYIFGDNVEAALGHLRYLLFFVACGVVAGLSQVAVGPTSSIPIIGASGAIAGVLGAYIRLYPKAPIQVLNPVFLLWLFFGITLVFPAWLVIGLWFLMNLVDGFWTLGRVSEGGVAFFAHIGGFLAGLYLCRVQVKREEAPPSGPWNGWRSSPASYPQIRARRPHW